MKNYGIVSVIVPVYNVKEYLPKCLDSILAQSYKNIEIIAVDDGSKDTSGEICDKYASMDNRVKVIHQKNKGLSGARNTGLDVAKGDFIYFVDSDDWIDSKLIEDNLNLLIEKDADMVCFNTYLVNNATSPEKWFDFSESFNINNLILALVKREKCVSVCSKIYRKYIWEKTRFREKIKFEDWYIMPEVLVICKKIACNPNGYYYYNKLNESSILTTIGIKGYFFEFLCYKHILEFVDRLPKGDLVEFCNNNGFKIAMKILRYNMFTHLFLNEQIEEVRKFVDNVTNLTLANKLAYWDYKTINFFGFLKGLEYYLKTKMS